MSLILYYGFMSHSISYKEKPACYWLCFIVESLGLFFAKKRSQACMTFFLDLGTFLEGVGPVVAEEPKSRRSHAYEANLSRACESQNYC